MFCTTLCTNNPEALGYFNEANTVSGLQPQALADAICTVLTHIEDWSAIGRTVEKNAHCHVALCVTPDL